jgi:sterol desaturase/sphingolipid hydroxylase (fatty acid hydroxylase superfamily)
LSATRHSHVPISFGFMEHVLVSPRMHQQHHSIAPEHVDVNMGLVFSFWDRALGTWRRPAWGETFTFGVVGRSGLSLRSSLLSPFERNVAAIGPQPAPTLTTRQTAEVGQRVEV